jgi:hypothetical protein
MCATSSRKGPSGVGTGCGRGAMGLGAVRVGEKVPRADHEVGWDDGETCVCEEDLRAQDLEEEWGLLSQPVATMPHGVERGGEVCVAARDPLTLCL